MSQVDNEAIEEHVATHILNLKVNIDNLHSMISQAIKHNEIELYETKMVFKPSSKVLRLFYFLSIYLYGIKSSSSKGT